MLSSMNAPHLNPYKHGTGKRACHFSPETEKDKRLANPPSSDTLLAGY